ncbi:MAG TPA: hypothetical protein VM165_01430 [Planctomycetaceae bacterium]|nr:hypothetical protein [Planctomycetaceae bacterium]
MCDGGAGDEGFPKVYRLRRYYFWVGVVGTIFFGLMDAGSVYAAAFNIDGSFPRPVTFAIVFGIVWTAFFLLGIWLILSAVRERLDWFPDRVHQQRVLGGTTIPFTDIDCAAWWTWPRGACLVLTASGQRKIKVDFENFTSRGRVELIEAFHTTIAPELQRDWDAFAKMVDGELPPAMQKIRSRNRTLVLCGIVFASGLLFTAMAFRGGPERWIYHLVAILNYLAALWVFFRPSKRSTDIKPDSSSETIRRESFGQQNVDG